MAVPTWAQRIFDEDRARQEQEKQAQSQISTQSMADFRQMERETPIPEVKPPSNTATRLGGAAALGLGKGIARTGALATDIAMGPYDLIMGAVNPDYVNNPYGNIFPRSKGFDELWQNTTKPVSDNLGLKGTTAEHIVGGMTEFISPIGASGAAGKALGYAPKVASAAAKAGEKIAGKVAGKGGQVLGKGAEAVIKQSPDMVNTWLIMEANKPPEERLPFTEWAAMWAGSELAMRGIGAGVKAGLGKLNKQDLPQEVDFSYLDDIVSPEPTPPTKPLLALPEGKTWVGEQSGVIRDNPEMPFNLGQNKSVVRSRVDEPGVTPSKPEPKPFPVAPVLNRNVDMASLPDRYPLPDVGNLEGRALINRLGQQQKALPGKMPLALPEPFKPNWEIGTGKIDPKYQIQQLAKLQREAIEANRGNIPLRKTQAEIKDTRFAGTPDGKMLDTQGTFPLAKVEGVNYPTGTAQDKRIFTGADETQIPRSDIGDPKYLASLEKQYNDMVNKEVEAIKDSLGGVVKYMPDPTQGPLLRASQNPKWYRDFYAKQGREPREGEFRNIAIRNLIEGNPETGEPANDAFLGILSELSRGQKLPAEWHGLQKSIRELTETGESSLKGLVDEMKVEQGKAEPYGLARNFERLDEIENKARQAMKDIMDYRKQHPNAMFAVNQDAELMKNLVIVGASKIARKGLEFKQWADEMIAEFGEMIRPRLQELWQQSSLMAKDLAKTETATANVAGNVTDNIKIMIQYGAGQVHKGGKTNFAKLMKAQFPDMFSRYSPEIQERLINDLFAESSKLAKRGQTAFRMGEKNVVKIDKSWNHTTTKTKKEPTAFTDGKTKTYGAIVDDVTRLKQFDNLTGKVQNPKDRTYLLALNSREAGGTAKNIVVRGLVDPTGTQIGESLQSITKQIPKGKAEDFSNYLIYRHAPSWLESGKKVFPDNEGITADISRERARVYEQANPEFKQLADRLIKWQRDLKKSWLVDTGIIKPEEWEAMAAMYPDYVPLRRKMKEGEEGALGGLKRGFANQSSPIKKATGSQREIIDPIESIIEDADRIVKIARRNQVMQGIGRKIQEEPEAYKHWIELLPEKGETFESAFRKDGMEGFIDWLEEPFEEMVSRKNVKYDKPNVVRARVNGETIHFKVHDPILLNALTNLTPQGAGVITETFRQGTRIMKILTTGSNPIFATRNISRDLPMAYIASDTLTRVPVLREMQFVWGILDSFARIVTNGKYDPGSYYKAFRALGGGTHSSAMASDRNLLAESKSKILPGYYDIKSPVTTLGRGLKGIGRGVEAFTNAGETIPRLPEFVRTVKKGGDTAANRQLGLFKAQDVTVNFSKRGTVSKEADAFIPYLNASLQGIDKVARIYKNNPLEAIQRSIIAVTVPTIWLWNMNHDNPNYQKLSSYVKDNYFCIPKGDGTFVKIAKPRETAVVFGSMVERALNKWKDDDPNGFRGFAEAWTKNFAPPTRWLGAPLTDVISNKNFYGAPIVPGYMSRLSPELQYDENTSAPAKALGKLGISPKKTDYLMRSYTGVLGELGIPVSSEGRGETALQRGKQVLKKTFTADPLYSNDTLTYFYDAKEKLDAANNDFNATKVKGENYNPANYRVMNQASTKISDINRRIRNINKNKEISYEEKDRQVRELKQKALDIAEQALARIGEL